ncbi:MAG: type II toxin-antitoxin system HicA family toxin [Acidobacteriia bacterium]|nr:type II toxin-antitoxin system HicA family toxin [Terriglobia bacterium]
MSPKLRRLTSREILRVLHGFGFDLIAQKGSHAKLCRELPGGERQILTVPIHREMAPGTILAIYRQAGRFIPESDLRLHFYSD